MLQVRFGPQQQNCAGIRRRNFLEIGSLGVAGLTLSNLLASRAKAAAVTPSQETSVVWLWLNGGPTHIETFDPKMTAPVEYRRGSQNDTSRDHLGR